MEPITYLGHLTEPSSSATPASAAARPRLSATCAASAACWRPATTCAACTRGPTSSRSPCAGPREFAETAVPDTGDMLHTTSLGRAGLTGRLLPRPVRPGPQLDGDRASPWPSEHRALLVDLPHHGRSGWSERLRLRSRRRRGGRRCSPSDDPVTLVGHSMGGKVAMVLALRHPELVERLCVVDIAPVDYGSSDEFQGYVEAMHGLDLDAVAAACGRRRGADRGRARTGPCATSCCRTCAVTATAGAGRPTSRCWATELTTISGWPEDGSTAWRRTTGRCCGSPAPTRGYVRPRARGGDGALVPAPPPGRRQGCRATGCTPSSPRCSARCCGASWATDRLATARPAGVRRPRG